MGNPQGLQRPGLSTQPPAPSAGRERSGCTPPSPLGLRVHTRYCWAFLPHGYEWTLDDSKRKWEALHFLSGAGSVSLCSSMFINPALIFKVFKFLAAPQAMWDPHSPARDRSHAPYSGAWSPNHRTAREVLVNPAFKTMGY